MNLVEWFLIALPVAGMVFIAGCGVLDMGEASIRAWRRQRARRARGGGGLV